MQYKLSDSLDLSKIENYCQESLVNHLNVLAENISHQKSNKSNFSFDIKSSFLTEKMLPLVSSYSNKSYNKNSIFVSTPLLEMINTIAEDPSVDKVMHIVKKYNVNGKKLVIDANIILGNHNKEDIVVQPKLSESEKDLFRGLTILTMLEEVKLLIKDKSQLSENVQNKLVDVYYFVKCNLESERELTEKSKELLELIKETCSCSIAPVESLAKPLLRTKVPETGLVVSGNGPLEEDDLEEDDAIYDSTPVRSVRTNVIGYSNDGQVLI